MFTLRKYPEALVPTANTFLMLTLPKVSPSNFKLRHLSNKTSKKHQWNACSRRLRYHQISSQLKYSSSKLHRNYVGPALLPSSTTLKQNSFTSKSLNGIRRADRAFCLPPFQGRTFCDRNWELTRAGAMHGELNQGPSAYVPMKPSSNQSLAHLWTPQLRRYEAAQRTLQLSPEDAASFCLLQPALLLSLPKSPELAS